MRIKKASPSSDSHNLVRWWYFLTSIFMIVVIMFYQHENIEKDLL